MNSTSHRSVWPSRSTSRVTLPLQKYKAPTEKYIVQDGGTALLLPADLSTIQLQEAMKPYQRYKVRQAQGMGSSYSYFVPCSAGFVEVWPCMSDGLAPTTKVWHFRDAAATFKGMESPQAQLAFQLRIDHLKPVTQPETE